jgi:shikimate dehydrogenase
VSELFDAIRGIGNVRGGFVTVPHKQSAARAMDELTPRADTLGAVNAFKSEGGRLVGDMTDGPAFLYGARRRGFDPEGARVAIIGGGAAASAIALACAEEGVADLTMGVRRQERHDELRRIVMSVDAPPRLSFDLDSLEGFDLIINGTTVGMGGDPNVPYSTDSIGSASLVAEVVTLPRVTPWLSAALEKGCRVQYGEDMTKAQTQIVSPWWGLPAPQVEFR